MRAADRSLDVIAFVSEHFRDIIRRRLSELAGLALVTLALLGAIALATWSVQDPSLSHATQQPIHNLLGFTGAIFSDLAMQLLGLAAILLLAPEVLLAWLGMIVHGLLSWKARFGRMLRREPRTRLPMPVAHGPRQEPRFDGYGRALDEYEDDIEEEDDARAPRKRATSRTPVRRSTNGYALPSLNLLAAPRATERTTLSRDIIDANATALESVLQDFGVRGEILNARA